MTYSGKSKYANRNLKIIPRKYERLLQFVVDNGMEVAPRGEETHELVNFTGVLRNPLDRVIANEHRKMNIAFAMAEFYGTLFGINDIAFYETFIKSYGKYSSDGQTLDGCYGDRINERDTGGEYDARYNQVLEAARKLIADPMTRRAVISVYQAGDSFGGGGLNTPCTISLQFLARDYGEGEGLVLDCFATMRSNDVWFGLTYDLYNFTMIHELVARLSGLTLGEYTHNAASFHMYKRDVKHIAKMEKFPRFPFVMRAMPTVTESDLEEVNKVMRIIHTSTSMQILLAVNSMTMSSPDVHEYFSEQVAVMSAYIFRDDTEQCIPFYEMVDDDVLKRVLRLRLHEAKVKSRAHKL